MIVFTILGFVTDGQHYVDYNFNVRADSPADAIEKAVRQNTGLVVSSVIRTASIHAH